MNKISLLIIFTTALLLFSGCASTAKIDDIDSRQRSLESRLIQLENKSSDKQETKVVPTGNDQDKQIRALRGRIDLLERDLKSIKNDLTNNINSSDSNEIKNRETENNLITLKKKVDLLELNIAEMQKNPAAQSPKTLIIPAPGTDGVDSDPAKTLYLSAKKKFDESSFINALGQFDEYMFYYPKGSNFSDSLYYAGYIHSTLSDFQEASLKFYSLVQDYKESEKYHESMWLLAVSYDRQKKVNDAKTYYKKISQDSTSIYKERAAARLKDLS